MFGLFSNKGQKPGRAPKECPVPIASRDRLEASWQWLTESFGADMIRSKKALVPDYSDFPIRYNGDPQTAYETASIVAAQMDIDPDSIQLELYNDGLTAVSSGSPMGGKIYLGGYANVTQTAGLYIGKEEDGKYHVWLENRQLTDPVNLVATLAHEFAHIKLLGESRIQDNDEFLTDMTTIVYGLGIFNANTAFQTINTIDATGTRNSGYLMQREWGYGLALFARLREETDPGWIQYLNINLRSDFVKSQAWLAAQ